MTTQFFPKNEDQRLKALQSYDVMDTIGEEAFDRITQLASVICGVPIALVSLIDENRQWFKSKIGLDVPETPRDISFCQHAILGTQIFEIENALEDERFKDNPLVQGFPNIRFYAGFPLEDPDGYNLGTLCVIDEKPHKLDESQRLALSVLGKEVVAQLVARKKENELKIYKSFFDLSVDLMSFRKMEDIKVRHINFAYTKVLGWTEEELQQFPILDIVHPEDKEKVQTNFKDLYNGNPVNFEMRVKSKEGKYIPLEYTMSPNIENSEIYTIAKDITIRKELENSIVESKNELITVFDTISEGVVVQKLSGEIISCNPAACRILKLTEDQLTGKSSFDPDWNCIKEDGSPFPGNEHPSMAAINSKQSIYNVVMGVRIHEGEVTWISINAELLPNEKGVVTTFTDISERKEVEDNKLKLIALEASNKIAEDSLKAREEFLANMSHEIRTPMNAIIGLSNLMDKAGSLNEKQTSYLDVIKLNSDNLLKIINDILDYSKLESGNFEIERTNVPLKDTICNIVTSLKVLADKKNIKIHLKYDQKLPIYIKTDGLRISQIVTNLISNAIKFSNNKDITVEIIQNFCENYKVSFTTKIIDHGIGIARENIDNITKPFTQETSSTTRKFGGTGLGLSIVSKLLKILGSELIIESEEGKGSTFSFTLCKEIGENTISSDHIDYKLEGKYHLLLVEDNQFNQLVAIDSLMEWNPNFDITVANDGEEALNALQKYTFDLVLMDIQMPIMDGYEATRAIRLGDEAYHDIPIIAMTAHTSSMEIEKCINMGMDGFLSKPFNEKDLHQKIASIIYNEKRENQSSDKPPKTSESNVKETSKMEVVNNRVVDLDAIVNFTKGKIDRIEKMVNMFLTDTPDELLKLNELFEQRNYPALITLAHSFKPKFAYMGMQHLSDIAKSIEHNADLKTNETEIEEGINELMNQSKKAYDELTVFLKEEQSKNS